VSTSPIAKKICLIGDFSVGKTSSVRRFVNQVFSETYQTTIGVNIETKTVVLGEQTQVKLIIWDIAGKDVIGPTAKHYLTGMEGYLLVVDGTHLPTVKAGLALKAQILEMLGPTPFVCLINKVDLVDNWLISEEDEQSLARGSIACFRTSAKTGEHIETAFTRLATELLK